MKKLKIKQKTNNKFEDMIKQPNKSINKIINTNKFPLT